MTGVIDPARFNSLCALILNPEIVSQGNLEHRTLVYMIREELVPLCHMLINAVWVEFKTRLELGVCDHPVHKLIKLDPILQRLVKEYGELTERTIAAERAKVTSKIEVLSAEVADLKRNNDRLAAERAERMEPLSAEVAKLKSSNEQLSAEVARLRTRDTQLCAEVARLKTRDTQLCAEITRLQSINNANIERFNEEIKSLERQNALLCTQIVASRAALHTRSQPGENAQSSPP